jgi:hypothetical protein
MPLNVTVGQYIHILQNTFQFLLYRLVLRQREMSLCVSVLKKGTGQNAEWDNFW